MNKMKLIFILIPAFSLCSCSVFMAAHQPDKKNLNFLKPGVHQSAVRAELGQPVWSGEENGFQVDLFKFIQGYSKEAKVGRALFHGVADVLTLGVWEIAGTPIELMESGTDTSLRIIYDQSLRIQRVEIHQEGKTNVIDIGNPGGARR
jgi:hypothetical protein